MVMGIVDSLFRPVALIVSQIFFFNENPFFFSRFQKLRGRGNIFVFLVNLNISLQVWIIRGLSVYSWLNS